MRPVALCVFVALLVGCQASPHKLSAMGDREVLNEYVHAKYVGVPHKNSEEELRKRGLFTDDEWRKIADRNVQVGDPWKVVIAAWGEPSQASSTESTLGRFDYWEYRGADKRLVTLHEWKVVSIDRFN